MTTHEMIPTVRTLPVPETADGSPRRVGVEIELGNLAAVEVARIVRTVCGGTVSEKGPHDFSVCGTVFGDLDVYLDTRFRKDAETWLQKAGLDLAQLVVPVEIVTSPIPPEMLPGLDEMIAVLADQGATGTSGSIMLGFGVHLNIEIADSTSDHIGGVLTSFALLEAALRDVMQIDASRRLLPFTSPYPHALVDRLVAERARGLDALAQLYLEENPTRNSALDMLPIFAHLDPETVADRIEEDAVSARPAFHYRLPDCRLDEADWSVTAEWNRWTVIERAADEKILAVLCKAWLEHRAEGRGSRSDWVKISRGVLEAHGLEIPA